MYSLNFDGLYRSENENPGSGVSIMCYGWVVNQGRQPIARGYGSYTHHEAACSNGAEFLGLIEGLEALKDLGLSREPVLVMGDARSVILQMQGLSDVNSPRIKPLHRKARRLSSRMNGLQWLWVPRHQNKAADLLSRQALQQVCRSQPAALAAINPPGDSSGFRRIFDLMVSQRPAAVLVRI